MLVFVLVWYIGVGCFDVVIYIFKYLRIEIYSLDI